ncbi:hypothetical protein, partial [Anoxybacillus kestanbolensis]|uniref:hypothetical protein n=1 Tax=Anoxybacillus kestanbolensis TaxID=227476 RepID=UPI003D1911B1
NKGEFYTQVYEKPFCTQEPRGFSHREVQETDRRPVGKRTRRNDAIISAPIIEKTFTIVE